MGLDYEQLLIFNELSEIIRWQNQCIERMQSFREKYPYLIPPNVARMVEENLKENVQILYRELNHLHKPKKEKRRHVCQRCHGVFFVALPGGLCDECRAKEAALANKPKYGRVAPPLGATKAGAPNPQEETTAATATPLSEESEREAVVEPETGTEPPDGLIPKEDN
ncbi:MAG: hypothetical protein ACPL7D_02830 [Candidatus Sumerlaeaceae bacterium]|jgi:hypothetical protein